MPLDALSDENAAKLDVLIPDYSQMSLSQLMSDGRVSPEFKQKIQLRLQKVGFKIGLIKLSDFNRRDIAEELLYNAKKEEELRAWLEAMKFRFLNDKLEAFIHDEKLEVEQEIDKINAAIHKLEKTKGGAGQVDSLKRARESLKTVKIELDGLDSDRRASKNIKELQEVANQAESTKASSQNARHYVRNKRRKTPKPSMITPHSTTTATTSPTHRSDTGDDGEDEEEGKNTAKTPHDSYAAPKIKPHNAGKDKAPNKKGDGDANALPPPEPGGL